MMKRRDFVEYMLFKRGFNKQSASEIMSVIDEFFPELSKEDKPPSPKWALPLKASEFHSDIIRDREERNVIALGFPADNKECRDQIIEILNEALAKEQG